MISNINNMSNINTIINEEINKFVSKLVTESRESKNVEQAKKFIRVNSNEDATKLINTIRTEIPNVRLMKYKYIKGVANLYLKGELNNLADKTKLNKYLYVISMLQNYNDSMDSLFNNMSFHQIEEKFETIAQNMLMNERERLASKKYNTKSNYKIIPIDSYEEAEKYRKYVKWCVTYDEGKYNGYTHNGTGRFYFCLKKGFKNVPKEIGENCPLDEYGLSMIATSVNEDGSCNTITPRWNHDNGSNDHIMTPEELSDIIGMNYYEVFKPYTEEELASKGKMSRNMIAKKLSQGEKPQDIFDKVQELKNKVKIVELKNKHNFLTPDNKLFSNYWFDEVSEFSDGFSVVRLHNKMNYLSEDLTYLSGVWFDYASPFINETSVIRVGEKMNFFTSDGRILNETWFDLINTMEGGFAQVKLDGKWNFTNEHHHLISDIWFDIVSDFGEEDYAIVMLDGKTNLISKEGRLFDDNWFDFIGKFQNGCSRIKMNGKFNFITKDKQIISDLWFDNANNFNEGYAYVKINNKMNLLKTNGKLLSNTWYDSIELYKNEFFKVELNGKFNLINKNGETISDMWFDSIKQTPLYLAIVTLDNRTNLLTYDGKLFNENNWM